MGQRQGDSGQKFHPFDVVQYSTAGDKSKSENVEMNYSEHGGSIGPSSLNAVVVDSYLLHTQRILPVV